MLEVLGPCSLKWYALGFHLGVKLEDLNSLAKLKDTSEQLLREVLKLKVKGGEELTWGDVVIALLKAGEEEIAKEVTRALESSK